MRCVLEDLGLLERFRAGERAALEAVYRAHFHDVFRLARLGFALPTASAGALLPLAGEAQQLDFVQDVFVHAFSERARLAYDGLRPYRPFLLKLARHLRIDQLRREGRFVDLAALGSAADEVASLERALLERVTPVPPMEERLDWLAQRRATQAFVAQLSQRDQRFVELRFVAELSQREVAHELGLTRRKIRTLEERIPRQLERFLRRRQLWDEARPQTRSEAARGVESARQQGEAEPRCSARLEDSEKGLTP